MTQQRMFREMYGKALPTADPEGAGELVCGIEMALDVAVDIRGPGDKEGVSLPVPFDRLTMVHRVTSRTSLGGASWCPIWWPWLPT
jgi:hypothetical protein